jgi:hypothetical protein
MTYVGSFAPYSDVGEDEVFSFDFVNELQPGETISSVQWTVSDTNIAQAQGAPVFDGSVVSQRLRSLKSGTVQLGCYVKTSLGNRIHLYGDLPIQQPFDFNLDF